MITTSQALAPRPVANRFTQAVKLLAAGLLAIGMAACAGSGPQLPSSQVTGALPSAGSEAPQPARKAAAKVAMLLPLSGPGQLGGLARSLKQAAEMAQFDRSSPEFELMVKDDLGTPEGAKAAAEEAVKEGAELIIGPLLAASVDAVVPVASGARIPVLALSNDRRLARPGVYLLSFLPDQDVERIVSYAIAQGRKNFAALLPDDAYGEIVEAALKRRIGAAQVNLVAVEKYRRGGGGTLEATRRLGEALSGVGGDGSTVGDALLVPGEPETLASLGPLIAYARIDTARVKLLGSGGWDSPNVGRDPTFVGGWFPAPDQKGWQEFSERFTKTFGSAPPRFATLTHDAVAIAMALSAAPSAERFTAAGFTRASGFQGADGMIRFLPDGTAQRSLAVYEVQSVGASLIDAPAGASLAASQTAPTAARPAGATPLN